jgi:hypothetical protein
MLSKQNSETSSMKILFFILILLGSLLFEALKETVDLREERLSSILTDELVDMEEGPFLGKTHQRLIAQQLIWLGILRRISWLQVFVIPAKYNWHTQ